MRGLAILMVIAYHNFSFITPFSFGWLGVDLFFVLSGYLITEILINTEQDQKFLRNFYIRRVLRIFPLYYSTLLVVFFILPRIPNLPFDLKYYVVNQSWFWFYLQNWLLILKPSSGTNLIHHFWSIAVEEQFYLVWPLIILLLRKPRHLLMLMLIILIFIMLTRTMLWLYKIDNLTYYSLYAFTRVDGICIGCIVALLKKVKPCFINQYQPFIILSFAFLNFGFFLFNRIYEFTFPYFALIGYTTFAMLFGLLVHEGTRHKKTVLNKLLSWRPLSFLGKLSFGLYIFHWPVYLIFFPYLINALGPVNQNLILVKLSSSIICVIIAIGVSVISFYGFEKHFLVLKAKFK